MTASTLYIILNYVCPSIGVVLAGATFVAPVNSLWHALNAGSLGNLNPSPWPFMTGNCLGWIAYSYITKDLFVFFANAPGLFVSLWLNIGAAKIQYLEPLTKQVSNGTSGEAGETTTLLGAERRPKTVPPTPHELAFYRIILIWIIILSIVFLPPRSPSSEEDIARAKFVVGIVVNINLCAFFGAPLSTIATVMKTGDSSSIHIRTMVTNTTNSAFWVAYGFAKMDPYILIPNSCGVLFGVIQYALFLLYPRKIVAQAVPVAQVVPVGKEDFTPIV